MMEGAPGRLLCVPACAPGGMVCTLVPSAPPVVWLVGLVGWAVGGVACPAFRAGAELAAPEVAAPEVAAPPAELPDVCASATHAASTRTEQTERNARINTTSP